MKVRENEIEKLRAQAKEEATRRLRQIAYILCNGEVWTIKRQITCVAKEIGWSHERTFDIWYGRVTDIRSWEMDMLRVYIPRAIGP